MTDGKSAKRDISSRVGTLLLVCVLIVAAFVRLHGITDRGIFDYDEAWYLLEAKSLYDAGDYYQAQFRGDQVGSLKDYLRQRGDVPNTAFKPGHTLLILAGMLVFGPVDYASFAVSAMLGTATVFLVFLIGRRLFSLQAGLAAALFLALSPFHTGYSRAGYSQANSLFFFALGFYLWLRSRSSERSGLAPRLGAGLSLGYAFTCHFNLFTLPIVFGLLELTLPLKRGDGRETLALRIRRSATLAAAMAIPLLAFELPGRVLKMLGKLPDGQLTYYEQFAYRSGLASDLAFSTEGLFALLGKLFIHEGLIVVLAFATAAWVLKERRQEDMIVWAALLVPVLPWSFLTVGLPPLMRTFAVAAIPVALLVGRGFEQLQHILSRRVSPRLAGVTCASIIAINGALLLPPLLTARSGYREATGEWLDYVAENGGTIDIFPGSSWPIWYFYLSSAYNDAPEALRSHVAFYPGETDPMPPGGSYDALDNKRLMRAYGQDRKDLQRYLHSLVESQNPIVSVPNSYVRLPGRYGEVGGDDARQMQAQLSALDGIDRIEIYDLRGRPATALPVNAGGVGRSAGQLAEVGP